MNYCPEEAIEAGHSWGVLLYFVTTIPVATAVLNWLARRAPGVPALRRPWLKALLQYPYVLLSMWLAYLAFSLLIRVPVINRLFTVTTLTRYYRRYHEPGTRLKDI
jgi:hypothetical protein